MPRSSILLGFKSCSYNMYLSLSRGPRDSGESGKSDGPESITCCDPVTIRSFVRGPKTDHSGQLNANANGECVLKISLDLQYCHNSDACQHGTRAYGYYGDNNNRIVFPLNPANSGIFPSNHGHGPTTETGPTETGPEDHSMEKYCRSLVLQMGVLYGSD